MRATDVVAWLLCVAALCWTQAAGKITDYVTPCSLQDSKLDDCLLTQGQAMVPHLVSGIREWNVLPMDPLSVPFMQLQRGGDSLGLSISVANSTQYGWKDMKLNSVKFDSKATSFDVKWTFPVYNMIGDSETKGQLFLLPIHGTGFCNITFFNVDMGMRVNLQTEEKGGKTYFKITKLAADCSPKKIKFRIDNLFNNKQLSDTMNNFMNQNDQEIFQELKPNIDLVFGEILQTIIERMFEKIPANQLFKDFQ